MASFTAMIVIDHCVSNVGTNIKKSQNQKRMKFSFTDIANISFLWKYAKTIKHEMQIYFVEIASKTPICSKCIKEHRGHEYDDLEDIYADKYALWSQNLVNFQKSKKKFLPTTQGLKSDIQEDAKQIKEIMQSMRTFIKS